MIFIFQFSLLRKFDLSNFGNAAFHPKWGGWNFFNKWWSGKNWGRTPLQTMSLTLAWISQPGGKHGKKH